MKKYQHYIDVLYQIFVSVIKFKKKFYEANGFDNTVLVIKKSVTFYFLF